MVEAHEGVPRRELASEKFRSAIPFSGPDDPNGFSSFQRLIPEDTDTIVDSLNEIGIDPMQTASALEKMYIKAGRPQQPINLRNQDVSRWYDLLSDTLHTVTTYLYLRAAENGILIHKKSGAQKFLGLLTPAQLSMPLEERWLIQDNIPSIIVMTGEGSEKETLKAREVLKLNRERRKRLKRITEYNENTGEIRYKTESRRSRRKTRKYNTRYLRAKLSFEKEYLKNRVEIAKNLS